MVLRFSAHDALKFRRLEKSGHLSEEWKEKAASFIEKGKEFVEQKRGILSSAFDAGKEAMQKEKEEITRAEEL